MDPKKISIADYTYLLPEERIAHYPLPERDASKLLVYRQGQITETYYRDLATQIPENSLLVFNNTKVIEARLLFTKNTGAVIEIFCLEPHEQYADITAAMLQKEKVLWQCLVGGVSKWKPGQVLEKSIKIKSREIILRAAYVEKRADTFIIELSWQPGELHFAEILHEAGAIPLPPYIKRKVEDTDKERYQTLYADKDGSVAAPTAGLHFTASLFESIAKKNVQTDFVTLHVGAGTFKPVKAETMEKHEMHAEFIHVAKTTIENILQKLDTNIIAVGTTSLRTLESLYWLGTKIILQQAGQDIALSQWEAYELAKENISPRDALKALLANMEKNDQKDLLSKTQLLIVPGYKFKIVNALVTNFHQPHSTLLLLVAALIGNDWKKIYEYALQHGFRFLSYGDGNLLWANND